MTDTEPVALKCFVIGPIGDRLAPIDSPPRRTYEDAIQIFEEVIQPACESFGIKPIRADKMTKAGEIPEQIVRLLATADLVIADLTGANPNVMYELGLRHATGLPAIQLGEHGRLPFDIAAIRTIQFARTETGLVQARHQLQEMIATGVEEGFDPVTASRVLNSLRGAPAGEATTEVVARVVEDETPGFLELIAEMEDAYPRVTGRLEEIGGVIQQMGTVASAGSEEFQAEQKGRTSSAKTRLLIVRKFAESLDRPAAELENLAADYEQELARVDRGISYLLDRLEVEPQLLSEAPGFPDSISRLASSAREALDSVEGLGSIIVNLGSADRILRTRTSRIATALNRVVSSSAPIFTWNQRLQQTIEARKKSGVAGRRQTPRAGNSSQGRRKQRSRR